MKIRRVISMALISTLIFSVMLTTGCVRDDIEEEVRRMNSNTWFRDLPEETRQMHRDKRVLCYGVCFCLF